MFEELFIRYINRIEQTSVFVVGGALYLRGLTL